MKNNNSNRKHIKTFENHSTNVNTNTNSFEIGDLVFDKTAGNSGLVGLVVGKPEILDDEFENDYTQKVLFRGYGGDIIDVEINDVVDIINDEQLMELAEKKGDLSAYKSIAKKSNITLNPKYEEYIITD